jgi:hypothetical protein
LYARSKGRHVLDAALNALSDDIEHRVQFSINIVVDKIAYTFCRDPIIPIRELRKHGILRDSKTHVRRRCMGRGFDKTSRWAPKCPLQDAS